MCNPISSLFFANNTHKANNIKEYDTNPIASPVRPTYESWADEILGLDDPVPYGNGGDSIDDEINAYYSDPQFGLSMLSYWEVSMNRPALYSVNMLNFSYRKAKCGTQEYFHWHSTFCQSRDQQYRASKHFPPVLRLTPDDATTPPPSSWKRYRY